MKSSISKNMKVRSYIINLQKNRSIIALIASSVSLICAIYGINFKIIMDVKAGYELLDVFQYFTIDANIIAALASAMIIPYAIDGV